MAAHAEWSKGYARQAKADFETYQKLQAIDVPSCHRLPFLHMACEKLVKAHLCDQKSDPLSLQASHAYVKNTLPVVLRQEASFVNFRGGAPARSALLFARQLAVEIDLLAPAVKRGGKRPDNCEYPWEDATGRLHSPLDWSFAPAHLLLQPRTRNVLKLIQGAIGRLLS